MPSPTNFQLSEQPLLTRLAINLCLILMLLLSWQHTSWAQSINTCERLEQSVDHKFRYLDRVRASIELIPTEIQAKLGMTLIAKQGLWQIFEFNQADTLALTNEDCRATNLQGYDFFPVMQHLATERYAVANGLFMIRVHDKDELLPVIAENNLILHTRLPSKTLSMIKAKTGQSYDELVFNLGREARIKSVIPVLAEPHYRLR